MHERPTSEEQSGRAKGSKCGERAHLSQQRICRLMQLRAWLYNVIYMSPSYLSYGFVWKCEDCEDRFSRFKQTEERPLDHTENRYQKTDITDAAIRLFRQEVSPIRLGILLVSPVRPVDRIIRGHVMRHHHRLRGALIQMPHKHWMPHRSSEVHRSSLEKWTSHFHTAGFCTYIIIYYILLFIYI